MATTRITAARPHDAADVAWLAAVTFPLACPPGTRPEDAAGFIVENLSPAAIAAKLADPNWLCLIAWRGEAPVGYTLTDFGPNPEADDVTGVDLTGSCLLSKCYVLPAEHGGAVAGPLLERTLREAAARGASGCWLGVNRHNERAVRFYRKHGFAVAGERIFTVGSERHEDFVMCAPLPEPPPAT